MGTNARRIDLRALPHTTTTYVSNNITSHIKNEREVMDIQVTRYYSVIISRSTNFLILTLIIGAESF